MGVTLVTACAIAKNVMAGGFGIVLGLGEEEREMTSLYGSML